MTFDFGASRWLWLLTLLPVVWLAGRAGLPLRDRPWSSLARLLVLVFLIGALAQPELSIPATRTALVYLVDGSHSVSGRAMDAVAQAIETTNAAVRPDTGRILAFGGRVANVPDTTALRRLGTGQDPDRLALLAPDST